MAHPGSQVVQPDQVSKPIGVLLAVLQIVDQVNLPLYQRLGAAWRG